MKPVIVIHGGAGAISRSAMSGEKEREYHEALAQVLRAGQKVLEEGGTAVDAVTAAVVELENCPLFNAGRGAVFTSDATHELDAAIMDGRTLRTGAIANVHHVRNPILAARQVMQASRHVFFVGEGAERFAKAQGLELVDPAYFSTPSRREQLERVQRDNPDAAVLDHDGQAIVESQPAAEVHPLDAGLVLRPRTEVRERRIAPRVVAEVCGHVGRASVGRPGVFGPQVDRRQLRQRGHVGTILGTADVNARVHARDVHHVGRVGSAEVSAAVEDRCGVGAHNDIAAVERGHVDARVGRRWVGGAAEGEE